MHPILEDRRRLALYLLAWLLVGVLLTVGLRSDAAWTTYTRNPDRTITPNESLSATAN